MSVNNDGFFTSFVKAVFEDKKSVVSDVRHELSESDFTEVISNLLKDANQRPDSHLSYFSTVFKQGEGYTYRPLIVHTPDESLVQSLAKEGFASAVLHILALPLIGIHHLSRVIKHDTAEDHSKDFLVAYLEKNKDYILELNDGQIKELESKFGLNKEKVDAIYKEALDVRKERYGVITEEDYLKRFHEHHIAPLTAPQKLDISEKEYREQFGSNQAVISANSRIPSEEEYRRLYHSAQGANEQFKNIVVKPRRWKEGLKPPSKSQ